MDTYKMTLSKCVKMLTAFCPPICVVYGEEKLSQKFINMMKSTGVNVLSSDMKETMLKKRIATRKINQSILIYKYVNYNIENENGDETFNKFIVDLLKGLDYSFIFVYSVEKKKKKEKSDDKKKEKSDNKKIMDEYNYFLNYYNKMLVVLDDSLLN